MADSRDDPLATLARLLTAEAAYVRGSPAGALLVAVAAAITGGDAAAALGLPDAAGRERRVVVQRGQMVELGGLSLARLLRFAGAVPVEAGTVERCPAEEVAALLADGPAAGLFVERADSAGLVGLAEFVWACRRSGVPALALPAGAPLAALDAGADLVIVDLAHAYGGAGLGLIAGRADLIAACAVQEAGVGALFPATPTAVAEAVALVRAAAADLAAGRAVADLGG
jgi:L-seryl-tRNA(Ser) seleniumtransferase